MYLCQTNEPARNSKPQSHLQPSNTAIFERQFHCLTFQDHLSLKYIISMTVHVSFRTEQNFCYITDPNLPTTQVPKLCMYISLIESSLLLQTNTRAYFLERVRASAVISWSSLLDMYNTNHCTITMTTTQESSEMSLTVE